jgi:hypothetical protein
LRVCALNSAAGFARFFFLWWRGVFAGVFEKNDAKLWCFCGRFVVKCVVKAGKLTVTFRERKLRHDFELYFAAL